MKGQSLGILAAMATAAALRTTAEKEHPTMEKKTRIRFSGEDDGEGLGLGFSSPIIGRLSTWVVKEPTPPAPTISSRRKSAAAKARDSRRRKATHRMKVRARAAGRG